MTAPVGFDADYRLEHRYTRERGRVYLTGVQALVRLPLMQRRRDQAAGLNTAGFISGYRGSPLGTYDLALWQAKNELDAHHVVFEPGSGQPLSGSFMDYAIPRADDLPFFTVELNELPESDNPLGVKGAGENATTGAPAALMNAVRDALDAAGAGGVDMPATREQVWRALSRARRPS